MGIEAQREYDSRLACGDAAWSRLAMRGDKQERTSIPRPMRDASHTSKCAIFAGAAVHAAAVAFRAPRRFGTSRRIARNSDTALQKLALRRRSV